MRSRQSILTPHRTHLFAVGCAVLASTALGCADAEEDPKATISERPSRGDLSELVGDFQVRWIASNPATGSAARANVLGVVKDGPEPQPIAWHVAAEDGPCKLLEPEAPFCETPCGGGAVCTAADTCTPYPKSKPIGTVYLEGVTPRAFAMEAVSGSYMPVGVKLPYPPCAEGDAISLRSKAGDYAAFEREARCIAPLEFDATPKLETGRDLALAWGEPGEPDLARIEIKLDVSHHGGAKGKIECDTEDTGALVIPSALVDRLVELGVSGFPTIALTRISRSPAEEEPRGITLTLFETVERPVELPGLVSCTDDRNCPGGQRCAADLKCESR